MATWLVKFVFIFILSVQVQKCLSQNEEKSSTTSTASLSTTESVLPSKMSTSDIQSSTIKPSTSTIKKSTSTIKKSTSTSKPPTSTVKKSTSTIKPSMSTIKLSSTSKLSTMSSKPSTSTINHSMSTKKLSTSTIKPSTSTVRHSTSTIKPSTATSKVSSSTNRRSTSTMKQSSTSRRPSSTISPNVKHVAERRRRQVQVPVLPVDPTIGGKDGNPGAVLRFNKKLLVNNVEEACRKAEKTKPNERSVEEIVFLLPSGKIIITELFLTSLSLPLCLVDLTSPNILNWYTNGGRLAAYGSWVYIESSAPSVNYTGQLYVPPTHFSADLNTSIGRTDDNQPAVTNVDCIVELDESKMSFSSSSPKAREAIGKIEPNVTELISEALEITMCDLISYVLHSAVNNILSTFRTKIQLWDVPNVSLDYSLIADPIVDPVDLSISALLKGSMTVDDADVSIYPHDMASIGNNSKMVVTLFSDFVLNSLLASVYQADILRKITFDSTYSNKMAEYLKLECPFDKIHVGAVFPCNGSNASAQISLSINPAPSVIFLEGNGFMQMNGSICLHVVNSSSNVMLYMSPFSMIASLKPSLREGKLHNMIAMDASVLELKLNSTTNEASTRDKLIRLMSAILEEIVNKPLNYGIPVPMFLNNQIIKLRNHDLSFRNRTLVLAQNPM